MLVISKVKGLHVAIRTGHLQQFLTFLNKKKGGMLPFLAIYFQHSFFFSPSSHHLIFITKAKPFRLPITFYCFRLYIQETKCQRCHYPFPDWFLPQNQQKCKKCYASNFSDGGKLSQKKKKSVKDVSHLLFKPTKMYLL